MSSGLQGREAAARNDRQWRSGVTVLDDFAHHPTAVHETLTALRTGYPSRRIWAVFEPRSASSCRRVFQDDFARAFGAADEVVVAAVFRSLASRVRTSVGRAPGLPICMSHGQRARYIREVDDNRADDSRRTAPG